MNTQTPKEGTLFAGDGWIRAYSGTYVNVFDPKPEMFLIEDIAEGLAYNYRWGGHSKSKITVAEHSVWVATHLANSDQLAGLLHDASEAYLGDMASPIKKGMQGYKNIERRVMKCIAGKFGFKWPLPAAVKQSDHYHLCREWHNCVLTSKSPSQTPEAAKTSFVEWFNLLEEDKRRGLV